VRLAVLCLGERGALVFPGLQGALLGPAREKGISQGCLYRTSAMQATENWIEVTLSKGTKGSVRRGSGKIITGRECAT